MTNKTMKIAQIGSIWHTIPPQGYGGTERIIYSLTEGLVDHGHDVTLFASGTSQTSAKLVATYPRTLIQDNISWGNLMYPLLHITEAFDRHEEFDIIHMHLNKASDYLALPLTKSFNIAHKVVFTLHFTYPLTKGLEDRHQVLQKYKDLHYISISDAQRKMGENLNWLETVYNGIDLSPYSFHSDPEDYFVWLGKFNPDKGVREAILAAKKAGVKLLLAGKIDTLEKEDYEYYKTEVEPLIDGKDIQYVGEANDKKKNELLGNARALLMPIQWNEPFGLVMTESMATGTPVIAFRNGAAPEIITEGKTGYVVDNIDEMVEKIKKIETLDRKECRDKVEKYFSAQTMTENYLKAYEKLLQKS